MAGGREAARRLLTARLRPTGLICSNDLIAVGVLQEAAILGLHVPEEFSIVGFDGIAASWTQPDVDLPSFAFRPRLRLGGTSAPPP